MFSLYRDPVSVFFPKSGSVRRAPALLALPARIIVTRIFFPVKAGFYPHFTVYWVLTADLEIVSISAVGLRRRRWAIQPRHAGIRNRSAQIHAAGEAKQAAV